MSKGFELEFESRDLQGKANSRRLRRTGMVPAVLYGAGRDPRAISLNQNTLMHQMEKEAFYTSIISLKEGENTQPVIVKDVQRHPAKRQVLHVDFQRILEDEEITLNVPIHFLGEEASIGVKQQGGEVARLMTEIEVSCLPKDLPEFIELDISHMELNQLLHLSDVAAPEGVTFVDLAHERDPAVISINPPRREEEEVEAAEEEILAAAAEGEAEAPAEDEGEASKESSD
ncbi:MAG: 50S ribosomal protein L25/general stress protein Ctc [Gammaproteobacteria bacterium]|nr:50S ribosomal protein L25/general stress protein Ctc [Gammaproteobacteria bacterium]MDH3505836.1 50S ribosomal protein L25/general stress protein Ctc [Gammaproteobacteria bacterium]